MSQKTDAELTTDAQVIRDETTALANTKTRVYNNLKNAIDSKINNDKIVDEDNMASNSASLVPTQQSVKAYVDASGGGGTWGSITGTLSSQTDLNSALGAKAPIDSPTFTGTPTLPTGTIATTQSPGNNTTAVATTAFVTAAAAAITKVMQFAVTDEVTNIGAATSQMVFRMPYAMTLTAIRASLNTAQASGSIFTVDINENGTTILSTKLTIDNTEKTSTTAATPAVISDASLADDAEITVDVDQIGNGSAVGLKITFIGT